MGNIKATPSHLPYFLLTLVFSNPKTPKKNPLQTKLSISCKKENRKMKMVMHATLFFGSTENLSLYLLDLVIVFMMSLIVECLSHTRFISSQSNNWIAGVIQVGLYGIRISLAYLVMLAVMMSNATFVVAVAGYTLGFLIFGSRVFDKSDNESYQKPSDLPPLNC